jgi:hypothetical protein
MVIVAFGTEQNLKRVGQAVDGAWRRIELTTASPGQAIAIRTALNELWIGRGTTEIEQ